MRDDNSEGESMSATISLKKSMARSSNVALDLIQLVLVIAAFLFFVGMTHLYLKGQPAADAPEQEAPSADIVAAAAVPASAALVAETSTQPVPPKPAPAVQMTQSQSVRAPIQTAPVLSPQMQSALGYVQRRYKVSQEALVPVFEVAQLIGTERRIDPLLILSIIAIESKFNPFAESSMGAKGLMQVIPRFHTDKLPAGASERSLLDPVVNVQVGVKVLEEAIRRQGGLVAGLQQYAGSSDPEGAYATKVLAEKERLEQAARRKGA
ncbi:MAG: transglycosylase SLT domain-containing protein [Propionivibrio sp.]